MSGLLDEQRLRPLARRGGGRGGSRWPASDDDNVPGVVEGDGTRSEDESMVHDKPINI
jgi:hypothetical protein